MVLHQMTLDSHMDTILSCRKTETSTFPLIRQERGFEQGSKPLSSLQLMKSEYQQQLLKQREEKLVNLFLRQQLTALNKTEIYSHHHLPLYTTMQSDFPGKDPQALCKKGFSAGSHSRNTKPDYNNQAQMWPSNWMAKKSAGVAQAYPLRPVFHRKTASLNIKVGEPNTTVLQHSSPTTTLSTPSSNRRTLPTTKEEDICTSSPSQGSRGIQQRSRSNPGRPETWQIQKLEAMGEKLELEIQRKEALLREKLRRTEEELRRIQREKEQVEKKARNGSESHETGKTPYKEREAMGIAVTNGLKNIIKLSSRSSNEEEDQETDISINRSRPTTRNNKAWANPAIHSISYRHNSLFSPQEHTVVKLKKERLVASNSKMRAQEILAPAEISSHQLDHQVLANGSNFTPFSRGQSYCSPELLDQVKPPTLDLVGLYAEISSNVSEDNHKFHPAKTIAHDLVPCPVCGRNFLLERLEKHAAVCRKMQNSKRKLFDSSKARTKGTDLEPYTCRSRAAQAMQNVHAKKSTWRQKHESFIRTIRQSREMQVVIAKGGKLSDLPQPIPDENPDYIQCPHCIRRFAPKVAERHIPKCETIKNKPRPPPQRRH
ncbi:zinc finger C2HC domain-containing protein 1C [Microcaecilia unicolor]|uniref:Zinc finger C2HC domain-containing protein 1C n=1 Tax=Microcaecilia unicolor TaxID=1415580 RepID=A0A6P7Z664_9AMPH|nr:zinc finger C2HC domain-containing protein 1C [Microcaecilia unicolor]